MIENLLERLHLKPELYWLKKGQKKALKLFHEMAQRVPAYKDFLKRKKLDPSKIKTIADFSHVPPIDKETYLKAYPREMLCWDGEFSRNSWTIATTSGSTGEPFYFPRTLAQDKEYAITAELYLRTNFEIHKKSTLYIVGFPMGAWIGGVFTYRALTLLAQRGNYPLSIITPGINKLEIIKAVKNLGSSFNQIIIGSYGPFLKDILDDAEAFGINWKDYTIGFIFSAEAFSEIFRDYVQKKTGLKNIYLQTLNHYGTVDLGTMAHETPLCIKLRRMGIANKQIYLSLFGQITKLPTLAQYNPAQFYFEDISGNLLCSSYSGIPLVRYDLKDHGGIFHYEDKLSELKALGFDVLEELKKEAIDHTLWRLPFVYVYERSDFSVSFFAFQIYPETIRKALQDPRLEKFLTGKFTMQVVFDTSGNQIFEVNIELKSKISPSESLEKMTRELIVKTLIEENSEYRRTHEEYPQKTLPRLIFWPYEDSRYFRPGIKQKWVKK